MSITHTQLAAYANEYLTLQNEIKECKGRLEVLKEKLLEGVPAGTELSADGRRIMHSVFVQITLNSAAVKEQCPHIYEKFSQIREIRKLTVR